MSFLIFSPAIRRPALGAAALTLVSPASAQPAPPPVVVQPVPGQPVVVQPVPGQSVVVQPVPAQPVVQPAPEEIVIIGHYGKLPDDVESASSAVGYGDLDLSIPAHRDILRHRISLTARYLCDKLGENDTGPGSCREEATRDGMRRVGTIAEHFAPRGTAWVRPPEWVPPYPVVWVTQYP